jgi:glycosyltransferase involved in cell wall biosynthesis
VSDDFVTSAPAAEPPAVSVIIATYNRSQPLRHAIRSVCNSTLSDWEVIVVGDACTDDTAEVVSSFDDPRIRFVNLPSRCGDMSGPHNHVLPLARGRYVAFLNHDDLYLPDHLAKCVAELESSGADLVWVPCATARPKADPTGDWPFSFALVGVTSTFEYSPLGIYVASSWVFRRDLVGRVGPWRSPAKMYVVPSQDWLFRAWRSGATLRFLPSVSVILVAAGGRAGSYARRASPEHDLLAKRLRDDPRCLERILDEAAVNEAREHFLQHRYPPLGSLARRTVLRPVYALLARMGIHPLSLPMAIAYGRRGGFVRKLRRTTGAE